MWVTDLADKFPSFILTRVEGGTNFPIANILRHFFKEYASRIATAGPHAFPTSFNVVESFLDFSHDFFAFDLREERDHLLRLDDYLDWYTSGEFPEEPKALVDILPEAVIYSYSMAAPLNDFRLYTADSELALFGVSLVRHSTELSMIAIFGERPPFPPDEELATFEGGTPTIGRERIEPDATLSVADRYLDEAPGLSRVIALVRFDLEARQYNVRYVNIDLGPSYRLATDDPRIFDADLAPSERREHFESMAQVLTRYDAVFAALATLMFLPAFFIAEQERVTATTFATGLHARRSSTEVRKAVKSLGRLAVLFSREVRCLESVPVSQTEDSVTISPPELEFASAGFWKSLPSGDIGRDESGKPIVGRTWVERTDSWEDQRLATFIVRKREEARKGPNPGSVYVMRSGSHGLDLYKIGRTGLAPEERAAELTRATGVPTQFEVLVHWQVGDVEHVEREAHHRLRSYKVNRRREFFRAPLSLIVSTIGKIVDESA
jgi:hypothetical protein